MKYGFTATKKKGRQAKQLQWTVLKQQVTLPEQALKGSFIASYQMACEGTTHRLRGSCVSGTEDIVFEILRVEPVGKGDTIQHCTSPVAQYRICNLNIWNFVEVHTQHRVCIASK